MHDPTELPTDLPVPEDDGLAAHLAGTAVPSVALFSTRGDEVDLSTERGTLVVFAYPRTGIPGQPPIDENWDRIPGARGCTPHNVGFAEAYDDFRALDATVYGVSTQRPDHQREMAERLALPFAVLSDSQLALATALRLPTMSVAGETLLRRLAFVARGGVIRKVFYPVFPPNENAAEVLRFLRDDAR